MEKDGDRHFRQYLQMIQKLIYSYETRQKQPNKFCVKLKQNIDIVALKPQNIFVYDYPCYRAQKNYKQPKRKTNIIEFVENIDIFSNYNQIDKELVNQIYTTSGIWGVIFQNIDDQQFIAQSIFQIKNTMVQWKYLYKEALQSQQPKIQLKAPLIEQEELQCCYIGSDKRKEYQKKRKQKYLQMKQSPNTAKTQFDNHIFQLAPQEAQQFKKEAIYLQMAEIKKKPQKKRQYESLIQTNWDETLSQVGNKEQIIIRPKSVIEQVKKGGQKIGKKFQKVKQSKQEKEKVLSQHENKIIRKKEQLTRLMKESQTKRQSANCGLLSAKSRQQVIKDYIKIYLVQ